MDLIQLISAAGVGGIIGSLMGAFAQAWLKNKQLSETRAFSEKKKHMLACWTLTTKLPLRVLMLQQRTLLTGRSGVSWLALRSYERQFKV